MLVNYMNDRAPMWLRDRFFKHKYKVSESLNLLLRDASFTEYKSKWVKYHSIQGMNLFIIEVLLCLFVTIVNSLIFWPFGIIKTILKISLYAFMVIYAIIGIINVCNEEAKELPIINKFKFIKK